jgi:hypothetical protein
MGVRLPMRRGIGLLVGMAVAGVALAACHPFGDSGYVQINTVPVAPITRAALYLDAAKLDPIRQGSALLRQPVGTLTLGADAFGGGQAPLCTIVVRKDRITTVTISVLERPPRCVCKFTKSGDAADHTCVS